MSLEQQENQLQYGDLVLVLEAINLASSRGAFGPKEFTRIGGCYERIFKFLETHGVVSNNEPKQAKEAGI